MAGFTVEALLSDCFGGTTAFFEQLANMQRLIVLKAKITKIFFLIKNIYAFKFNASFWYGTIAAWLKLEEAVYGIADPGFFEAE